MAILSDTVLVQSEIDIEELYFSEVVEDLEGLSLGLLVVDGYFELFCFGTPSLMLLILKVLEFNMSKGFLILVVDHITRVDLESAI